MRSCTRSCASDFPLRASPAELRDFEPDDQQEIEVDEGNTAVIECHLPESQPKAQVRYSVKQEWLETSKGQSIPPPTTLRPSLIIYWKSIIPLSGSHHNARR